MNTENQRPFFCILAFLAPIIYQRTKFLLFPQIFEKLNLVRRLTGLNIHHGHWGLLIMIISGMWGLAIERYSFATISFYYGFGLVADEIIPMIEMPAKDRELELRVYAGSLLETVVLACVIVVVIAAVYCFVY